MMTEKQLAANRRNAQRSTGPRTDRGKEIVSHNAIRHGITGQMVILTPEDREAHDKFCHELIDSLQPESAIERQIAHSIAEDHFRINRVRASENNILAKACAGSQTEIEIALDTADAFLREAKQFQLLSLYEQRINRSIHNNHKHLRELQAERKAARAAELEQAMLLAQLSLSKGIAYNPAPDFPARSIGDGQALSLQEPGQRREAVVSGFVFSTAEINQAIDKTNRLTEAKAALATAKAASNRLPNSKSATAPTVITSQAA